MINNKSIPRNPWSWVPSLYFAEGLPYIVVMSVSVIMYKRLGISNTDIAFYTSWLYLPWVIKPFWSPVVDILKTKRYWIILMQSVIGIAFAGVAFTIPVSGFFQYTLAFFWLMAFSSATHDIAADGFYMIALSEHHQSFFVGIRSTFYRTAMLAGNGLLVILAGYFENTLGNNFNAWMICFFVLAGLFVLFFIYHHFIFPYPPNDKAIAGDDNLSFLKNYFKTFVVFFKKNKIVIVLLYILIYRLGEAQLAKIAPLFLLDSKSVGGLGLATEQVGFIYGTVGVIFLVIGGIAGGIVASKKGLKFWIWWMVAAINIPDLVYVFLSYTQTSNLYLVNICVAIEQFGYGFGFTAFLLFLIFVSEGEHKTSHYAIATGIMALGMMIPGMISGWMQELIGYQHFFVWVLISTIPAFVLTKFIPLNPEFGKRKRWNN
ncbi:MAG TPA: MFS transporter [Ignavibacteriaceae bacterium]|nr:MFS transporter [Ignavibacteriaceae bacterium]